jgi:hypothetical protein
MSKSNAGFWALVITKININTTDRISIILGNLPPKAMKPMPPNISNAVIW